MHWEALSFSLHRNSRNLSSYLYSPWFAWLQPKLTSPCRLPLLCEQNHSEAITETALPPPFLFIFQNKLRSLLIFFLLYTPSTPATP